MRLAFWLLHDEAVPVSYLLDLRVEFGLVEFLVKWVKLLGIHRGLLDMAMSNHSGGRGVVGLRAVEDDVLAQVIAWLWDLLTASLLC